MRRWAEFNQAELLTLFECLTVDDGVHYEPAHDDEPCRTLVAQLREEITARTRHAADWNLVANPARSASEGLSEGGDGG